MDYIREELLRQRSALARLLLGQGAEDEAREQGIVDAAGEYPEQSDGTDIFWASRKLSAGEHFRRSAGVVRTAEGEFWGVYSGLAGELPEAALRREGSGAWADFRSARTAAGGEEIPAYRQRKRNLDRERRGERRAASASREALPTERMVTETVWASPAESGGAAELSRVFQRDARRYDGGFTLY